MNQQKKVQMTFLVVFLLLIAFAIAYATGIGVGMGIVIFFILGSLIDFARGAIANEQKKWHIGFLAVLTIVLIFGISHHNSPQTQAAASTDQAVSVATDEPTDAPTPTPDLHAERITYQDYWKRVTFDLDVSLGAMGDAASELQTGDEIDASAHFKKAQNYADQASSESMRGIPDKFNDEVGPDLNNVAVKLSDAASKASAMLDDGKPSEAADAQQALSDAMDSILQVETAASEVYESLGGKDSDLAEIKAN
jgi:hypothetical protein